MVDEAAQATEPSVLIPMQVPPLPALFFGISLLQCPVSTSNHLFSSLPLSQFGIQSCVLVGDPQQLPATVFSQAGCGFERSLFERLETGAHPVHLLDTQYRMHPAISAFPRKHFYGSLLLDGANVSLPDYTRPYHRIPALQPFTFLNLRSDTTSGSGGSFRNPEEARLIVNLYQTLKRLAPQEVPGKVGVITPYSAQLMELNNHFARALGPAYTGKSLATPV